MNFAGVEVLGNDAVNDGEPLSGARPSQCQKQGASLGPHVEGVQRFHPPLFGQKLGADLAADLVALGVNDQDGGIEGEAEGFHQCGVVLLHLNDENLVVGAFIEHPLQVSQSRTLQGPQPFFLKKISFAGRLEVFIGGRWLSEIVCGKIECFCQASGLCPVLELSGWAGAAIEPVLQHDEIGLVCA